MQTAARRAQDRHASGRALEGEAGVQPKTTLPLAPGGQDEARSGPSRILRRDAVLHGVNRTRSGRLCTRGPDTFELLR